MRDLLTMQERLESLFGRATPGWVPPVDSGRTARPVRPDGRAARPRREDVQIDFRDGTPHHPRPAAEPGLLSRALPAARARPGTVLAIVPVRHCRRLGDAITADLVDGVLTVSVPKAPIPAARIDDRIAACHDSRHVSPRSRRPLSSPAWSVCRAARGRRRRATRASRGRSATRRDRPRTAGLGVRQPAGSVDGRRARAQGRRPTSRPRVSAAPNDPFFQVLLRRRRSSSRRASGRASSSRPTAMSSRTRHVIGYAARGHPGHAAGGRELPAQDRRHRRVSDLAVVKVDAQNLDDAAVGRLRQAARRRVGARRSATRFS